MSEFEMPDSSAVHNAITRDDSEQLLFWLRKGMPLNTRAKNESLLNLAAEQGAGKCLEILIESHIDLNNEDSEEFSALYSAMIGAQVNMVHALLENGANPATKNPTENYLHMAAYPYGKVERCIEIIDRFLAEGIDMHAKNSNGKAPLNLARDKYSYACMMTYRYDLDTEIRSRKIDKEGLHTTRKKPGLDAQYHQTWMEMPITWAWMDRILPLLEKKDECITREELEQSPKNMVWAMIGDNLPLLDAHLKKQDERGIGLADFVDSRGAATPVYKVVSDMWAEHRLLEQEWVKNLQPRELRMLYKAMPEEARDRIPNYHQIMNAMRNDAQPQTERGR